MTEVGKKYGKITIFSLVLPSSGWSQLRYVKGVCDCGTIKVFDLHKLQTGHVKSCGCLDTRFKPKHGLKRDIAYSVWSSAKSKAACGLCKMQKSWRDSFEEFLNDVGERPSLKHKLALTDREKGYVRSNCKWTLDT